MICKKTKPLDQAHSAVDGRSRVVCSEAADEGIEGWGSRAYAEQNGNFDEDEDEAGHSALKLAGHSFGIVGREMGSDLQA